MANHKSSVKRIRQDKKKALHNKYYAKTMRNAVRKLRNMTDKEEAAKLYPTVQKLLDKLAKINVIHENKAANLKSVLHSTSLSWPNFQVKAKEINKAAILHKGVAALLFFIPLRPSTHHHLIFFSFFANFHKEN